MMRFQVLAVAVLLAGCTSTVPHLNDPDASPDVTNPECVCAEPGPCCDGCDAINIGGGCDDGLECSSSSACAADGVCRGESDACAHLIVEPQCQAVTCSDLGGCGEVESTREGFTCDDDDPLTYDDRCASGACTGTPCECDAANECCDGCFAVNEAGDCDDGDPDTYFDACGAGTCSGRPCECSEGPCCDGCWFLGPETLCDVNAEGYTLCLTAPGVKPGQAEYGWADRYCSGTSALCDGALTWKPSVVYDCPSNVACADTEFGPWCDFP